MNRSVFQLISINFKEYFREPSIIFWTIIFPILMAWVLGVAFTNKSKLTQTVAIVHYGNNQQVENFLSDSKILVDSIEKTNSYLKEVNFKKIGVIQYRCVYTNLDSALLMIKQGKISIIVKEYKDSIIFSFDPANQDNKLSYILLSSAIKNKDFKQYETEIKPLTMVGTRYIDYLIPGLMAMGIMNSILWGISYALIDMRSKKLLRRMIATPMKKSYFLFSHFVSRLGLAIIETFILLAFAWFYFKITIQGSLLAFIMMFIAANVCFTGIAALISSRTSNSRVGTGLINFVSMPMTILSGVFFSYHNFPDVIIKFIQKLPLTIIADNFRAIFLEGAGVVKILPSFILLMAIGIIFSIIGLKFYKWY